MVKIGKQEKITCNQTYKTPTHIKKIIANGNIKKSTVLVLQEKKKILFFCPNFNVLCKPCHIL